MKIISIRQQPELLSQAINYFQQKWATEESMMVYQDAITRSINAQNPLPQWYLLLDKKVIIGCAGLIPNDFISRCELYPWLCALYIDPNYRNLGLSRYLVNHVISEAKSFGFSDIHLCTDLIGYYEKLGFTYNGLGYHPWGESSSVYSKNISEISTNQV
ncbi:GNAT family N-acetyltransferase [Orbus sturtevantii]|uniref:GNAT family N-acetyltransferase n=1 Tax=Orbus sturtevantii TaxID=3074109 RepID=UPI00370D534B